MSYGNGYSGDVSGTALPERAGSREELQAVSLLIVAMLNYHPLLVASLPPLADLTSSTLRG